MAGTLPHPRRPPPRPRAGWCLQSLFWNYTSAGGFIDVGALTGIDFKLIGKGIGQLLGIKGNPKKNSERVFEQRRQRDIQTKSFSDHMFERFSHSFFVETLKIKHEDIPMFLQYAEMPVKDLSLFLKPEYELQLIQYLTNKAKAYKLENQKE